MLLPKDGAVDVPRNALVWVKNFEGTGAILTLQTEAGVVVPGAVTTITTDVPTAIFHPEELLDPGVYVARLSDRDATRFTVADRIDDEPPARPTAAVTHASSDWEQSPFLSTCGPWHGASLTLSTPAGGVDEMGEGDEARVVLQASATNGLNVDELVGEAAWFSTLSGAGVGRGGCIFNWPGAAPMASEDFLVGSFDVAGNFSGFSEPVHVQLPPPGCSCDAAGPLASSSPPATAALVVAAAIAALTRPRRRRAASVRRP